MAAILVIGDLHFQAGKMQFGGRVAQAILIHLRDNPNKYNAIVVLGDTLHYFGKLECPAHAAATTFFRALAKFAPLHVLIGNHDRPNNRDFLSDIHPFNGLTEHPRITIYPRPGWMHINGFNFICTPYVPPGRLGEALQTLQPAWDTMPVTAVFSHQDLKGGLSDTGVRLTKGDIWHENLPLLINGHLHEYQVIARNIVCPGAPAQHHHVGSKERSISAFYFGNEQFLQPTNGAHGLNWREERIFLILPHLERIDIRAEDFEKWQLPMDENYYKLCVSGSAYAIRALRRKDYVQNLQRNNRVTLHWLPDSDQPLPEKPQLQANINSDFYADLMQILTPIEREYTTQLIQQLT